MLDPPSILLGSSHMKLPDEKPRARSSGVGQDMLVYLALGALVWLAWWLTSLKLFEAGDDVGLSLIHI